MKKYPEKSASTIRQRQPNETNSRKVSKSNVIGYLKWSDNRELKPFHVKFFLSSIY